MKMTLRWIKNFVIIPPFVYMQRPMDPPQFIRVLEAGLDGNDLKEAMLAVASGGDSGGLSLSNMGTRATD
jgi:hypothetical protein